MRVSPGEQVTVKLSVNGIVHDVAVESRWLLSDVLRHQLGLTGTHVGCENGACGCCTVIVSGQPARACLLFAIQLEGAEIETVESLAAPDGELHPLQESFRRHHGLQCGFCTPGQLMNAKPLYRQAPEMPDCELRSALSGMICRCTGYQGIVDAVRDAARIEDEREDAK
ncbi:(2Fe-2S)-binding protein [Lentzea pudingi]|uniref:(2Fe-2S)-binding protein n=1 Tax=Lentzea pudingi TaxID=1789439 RepID=A0ABQ2IVC6_9PSEU|nr:(2Fe-2S)-binding protein [Lentzea pudingi]GGN28686.1 (2Fe-2S)-binding protein [Lentzea pudingi]